MRGPDGGGSLSFSRKRCGGPAIFARLILESPQGLLRRPAALSRHFLRGLEGAMSGNSGLKSALVPEIGIKAAKPDQRCSYAACFSETIGRWLRP